jgi:hypothetical protein
MKVAPSQQKGLYAEKLSALKTALKAAGGKSAGHRFTDGNGSWGNPRRQGLRRCRSATRPGDRLTIERCSVIDVRPA